MKTRLLVSGLVLVLSTFLLPAQQDTASNQSTNAATEGAATETEKPDINEIIKSAHVFTNSAGMVMKKAGGLWVSAYETTQQVYQEVAGGNPSQFNGEDRPVDSISWNAASAFCRQLNDYEKANEMLPNGYSYALQTQAQWETLASGIPLKDAVTSSTKPRSGTAPVGSLPSKDGIYDLRGNVAEWCADPSDGPYRVLRGGSWEDWIEINLRPEFRVMVPPEDAKNTYGFRCVLVQGAK